MNYTWLVALIIGYVIGSLSPSYLLGWMLKGKDLRTLGDGNLGTTNTKKVLGIIPAIIVAVFDLLKGIAAVFIAFKFGVPNYIAYLAGILAVVGHVYPFYLKFRGGQGMATNLGLLFYFLALSLIDRNFTHLSQLVPSLIVIVLTVCAIFYITKRGELVGIFCVPPFALLLLLNLKITWELIALLTTFVIIMIVQIYNMSHKKMLNLGKARASIFHWRSVARPLALLFPILYFFVPKNVFLDVTGSIAGVFIVIDLFRLFIGRFNAFLFKKTPVLVKEKERRSFSSMTFFLTAIFILFLVFPQNIASIATVFITLGDLSAKFFGLVFGRVHFFDKTLEGSLAYFVASLFFGFVFTFFLPIPFWILVLGALTAAITEAISIFGIDDNFTVGLISASLMLALVKLA